LEFRHISYISEAVTDKRMKIDPYIASDGVVAQYVLFSGVQIALISQGVTPLGSIKQR